MLPDSGLTDSYSRASEIKAVLESPPQRTPSQDASTSNIVEGAVAAITARKLTLMCHFLLHAIITSSSSDAVDEPRVALETLAVAVCIARSLLCTLHLITALVWCGLSDVQWQLHTAGQSAISALLAALKQRCVEDGSENLAKVNALSAASTGMLPIIICAICVREYDWSPECMADVILRVCFCS